MNRFLTEPEEEGISEERQAEQDPQGEEDTQGIKFLTLPPDRHFNEAGFQTVDFLKGRLQISRRLDIDELPPHRSDNLQDVAAPLLQLDRIQLMALVFLLQLH